MRKAYYIILALFSLFIVSCYEDLGNYSYSDAEVITISGIENSYTKTTYIDRITIDPKVSSTDPKADFKYFWGVYENEGIGLSTMLDTISRTKAIDYLLTQEAKSWILVFGATNTNTGLTQYYTSKLNIVTPFSRGWYVLKDDGSSSDMDLFLTTSTIIPDSKQENIYSTVNKKKIPGKAQILIFSNDYQSDIITPGRFASTRALFAQTDQDLTVTNINTLKEYRDFRSLFFDAPYKQSPNVISYGMSSFFFVNNGNLSSIFNGMPNTGQFGVQQMRDAVNSPYDLSKYVLQAVNSDPLYFDNASSSFISAGGTTIQLSQVTDAPGSQMAANNNNKKIEYMGGTNRLAFGGYAILSDKTNPARKYLCNISGDSRKKQISIKADSIKTTEKLYKAKMYTLNQDESIMYFVVDNQVWSRNLSNNFEQLQYMAPAGEEISFIRHKLYTGTTSTELNYYYNYVMIATTTGGNYKVRMFTKTAGNLNDTPEFTLEGKGKVGDIIYISPNVKSNTYLNSF